MKFTSQQKSLLKKKIADAISSLKKEAIVYSVYSLSENEKLSIAQALEKKYGSVEIRNELSSSLLGGLIIEIDSQKLDLSLSSFL